MTDLAGYVLETLWQDDDLVLSRGARAGEPSILLLAPTSAQPPQSTLTWLSHAHDLRAELDPAWAARPSELLHHRGRTLLAMDDPGGTPLTRRMGRPWEIVSFLRVGIGIARALGGFHEQGLIHKDVKPAHILVDAANRAWLTGFGVASRLRRESTLPAPPEVIAGTLAYMAPEQTGRMNRSIDARSDLYALGVTLYEMLAGELPFSASDPMEWVHCHIARQPAPPCDRAPGIPAQVSAIVMKLLAKTAEHRYQTAAGLEADLQRCLAAWLARGDIDPFTLGEHDVSSRLLSPERLYGREAEIEVLLAAFERVVKSDTLVPELVLVSGYSGIGKSSVVNELHRVLVPPRGLFASGKFDKYKSDIPYATLAQAFQTLVRQILAKSEAEMSRWRDSLAEALGSNGQLMIYLIPELELIIGKQPPVPDLPPHDRQARFQRVFLRFLAVFARAEHPLALFLDDLQWLDTATLELLERLMTEPEVQHLMLVGAYRDNEVTSAHPLMSTLERIRRAGAAIREIVLTPLGPKDVNALVADTLRVGHEVARPLAELVLEKTGGNPFFIMQFIAALVDERMLAFDSKTASWQWDMATIRAKSFTDNVVELMALKLARLPEVTKSALRQLACLGNRASAAKLSLVYGVSEVSIREALWDAVRPGFVLEDGVGYAFLHDRVHEAAYAMIPEGERAAEHLRIGNILAARIAPEELEDNIFEIVNHLNRGAPLIEAQAARDRVAQLNWIAGQRAKASTATAAAYTYFALGRGLLGTESWQRSFRLTFDLELQLADGEFLTGELQQAEDRLDRLGARASTLTERAAVIYLQTELYTAMADRTDRAIQICLEYLRHVGIDWPAHPSSELVQGEYQQLVARTGGRSIEELLRLPLLRDPELTATLDVLLGMMTPAFNSDPGLVALILCRMGNLSLEHGTSEASSLGYAFLGMTVGCTFGDYRMGALFGKLAVDLVEERGLRRHRGRIYHTLGTHVLAWTQPVAAAQASLERGLQTMKENGDATYVGFGYVGLVTMLIAGGEELGRVQAEVDTALSLVRPIKFEMGIDLFLGQLRLIHALRGLLPDPTTLDDGGRHFEGDLTRCWYWIRTMQACFIFGDFPRALCAAQRAKPLIATSTPFFEVTEYEFYAALVCAACIDTASGDARAELQSELSAHRTRLAVWAETCPENYENRLALVDAEIARVEGRTLEASDDYERAIHSAGKSGFVHNGAIAFEVAARFYAARGFETIADAYFEKALTGYQRWGAHGKVRDLERKHPRLRLAAAQALPPRAGSPLESIDLATVVKTSQAVALQVGVERVIDSLMVIVLQHAGAERGLLILRKRGELWIEADATTERDGVTVRLPHARVTGSEVAESVLQYAVRTHESVLLDDAEVSNPFSTDPYLARRSCRSVLCVPIVKHTEVMGALYLENNLASHVFTQARIEVLQFLASQAAISLENASLEEKEALLNEVHHRVKNNLQLISSLLNLQASRIKDPAVSELFADSRNRVRSMALVHENLYRAGNFSKIPMASHIKALCGQLTRAYGAPDRPVELVIEVDELHLDMNRAISCGLIINELVSNALKHAFSHTMGARIQIDLEPLGGGRHALRIADNGVGLPPGFDFGRADSLGLQLVRSLTQQLNGTISVAREAGTTFTIMFSDNVVGVRC